MKFTAVNNSGLIFGIFAIVAFVLAAFIRDKAIVEEI
jgi:hypothetical protein